MLIWGALCRPMCQPLLTSTRKVDVKSTVVPFQCSTDQLLYVLTYTERKKTMRKNMEQVQCRLLEMPVGLQDLAQLNQLN